MKKLESARAALARAARPLVAGLACVLLVAACSGQATTTTGSTDTGTDAATEEAAVKATVTLDASEAGVEAVSYDVELTQGQTVYDALVATGVDVNASDSDYGMYVMGIDGLAGGDNGENSGWLFYVNGEMGSEGCSEVEVADGDQIEWRYVLDYTTAM